MKSDCWAIGVIFYKLLTNVFPFQEKSLKQLYREIVYDEIYIPKSVDIYYQVMLKGLLNKDEKQRWNIKETHKFLEQIL